MKPCQAVCPPPDQVSVLLVGAGSGQRMNGRPKAMLSCAGRRVFEHLVARFQPVAGEIILALRAADVVEGQRRLAGTGTTVIAGGDSRQETIARLVPQVSREWVMVHDVARPLVTAALVARVLAAAQQFGAALPCLPASRRDVVASSMNGFLAEPLDRDEIVLVQSPFACSRSLLVDVCGRAEREGLLNGSLSGLFRQAGKPVRLVAGDPENAKITFPEDWRRVRAKLKRRMTA